MVAAVVFGARYSGGCRAALYTRMFFSDKAFVGACGCKAYRMWRSLVLFFVASACYY